MTFAAYETADGSPVELLEFQNGAIQYKFTNSVDIIQLGAAVYLPLAYERTKFAQSKDSDDNNVTLTVSGQMEVVQLYNGVLTSSLTLLTIKRLHRDDGDEQTQVLWQGRVVAINRKQQLAEILLQPISHGGESTPRDVFSSLCNSFLFDSPGCVLIRTDWKFDGVVDGVSVDKTQVTVNGIRTQAAALDIAQGGPTGPLTSGELDLYWQGGYIVLANGETRDIVEGNIGGDPDVVRVDIPFRTIAVNDACTVYAGCSLTRQVCHKKFNNVINFQGYPDIPEIDPANSELPPGSSDRPNKFAGPGS